MLAGIHPKVANPALFGGLNTLYAWQTGAHVNGHPLWWIVLACAAIAFTIGWLSPSPDPLSEKGNT